MFHSDDSSQGAADTGASKGMFSWWPKGKSGPQDATEYLEYQRVHSEKDKALTALFMRNTHLNKSIEGDIRTTIEIGPGQSKVDDMHFSLGPNETKKVLVYPANTRMTYEVSAVFKQQ